MSLVVQKYGGTSLGNAERLQNVAKIIADTLEKKSGHCGGIRHE